MQQYNSTCGGNAIDVDTRVRVPLVNFQLPIANRLWLVHQGSVCLEWCVSFHDMHTHTHTHTCTHAMSSFPKALAFNCNYIAYLTKPRLVFLVHPIPLHTSSSNTHTNHRHHHHHHDVKPHISNHNHTPQLTKSINCSQCSRTNHVAIRPSQEKLQRTNCHHLH